MRYSHAMSAPWNPYMGGICYWFSELTDLFPELYWELIVFINSFSLARPVANRNGQCPVAHISKVQMYSILCFRYSIGMKSSAINLSCGSLRSRAALTTSKASQNSEASQRIVAFIVWISKSSVLGPLILSSFPSYRQVYSASGRF